MANKPTKTEIVDQWFRERFCNQALPIDTPTFNLIHEAAADLKARLDKE